MNVNEKVLSSVCCGCGVCVASCPTNAIKMSCSEVDWHLHPVVDEATCINCSKCVKCCPAINDKPVSAFEPYGFALTASDDIRFKSASGGAFYILAKNILAQKGYVTGAVYDSNFVVKHIVSNKIEDIERMRGSKYVQSDASEVYAKVEELLKKGETVLFSGTPCQIAGLKKLVGNKYRTLICVDILCHGTPSPKVFDYYLRENFDISQISNVIFRNKAHRNGSPGSLTVVMKDGREFYSEYFDNSYYSAFQSKVSERESCYDCKFAEFPRVGDISIGDFWGAKETNTKIDYEKGCSIAIINSPIGEKLWKNAKKGFKIIESYPLNIIMSWNRNRQALAHNARFRELPEQIKRHNSLRTATTNIIEDKYDVGIFGTTMNPNFGGLITYYALYEAIRRMGYTTTIINKPLFNEQVKKPTHSTEFFHKHCNVTKFYYPNELSELNKHIDRFVLGSDQVWNHNLFNCWDMSLYFDFVDDSKMKIAYAASFGHNYHDIKPERSGQASKNFKHFDFIGVRERDGVSILANRYSVNSTHVMDPVFLIPTSKYRELSEMSSVDTTNRYVGTYIIEPNDYKLNVVKVIAAHLGIDCINTTDGDRDHYARKSQWFKDRSMPLLNDATIYDWLKVIINSDFVITDSYHATCFCIMFNKPFILLQERWALSRIESIMNIFGLHDRWIQENNIEGFRINDSWFYPLAPYINEKLEIEVNKSSKWLKNALAARKQVHRKEFFTPLLNKTRVEDYFYFMLQNRQDYILLLSSCSIDKKILSSIDFKCKLSFTDFQTSNSTAFAMLYDYGNDYLIYKNENLIELKYEERDNKIICLVDNSSPKTNNVYVIGNTTEYARLSTDSSVVISVYSKSQGAIVDNFNVVLENDVAMIKR